MWNLIDRYARAHPEVEERLRHNKWPWPEGREDWMTKGITYDGMGVPAYSNNFEIVKIEAFQRPDVVGWIDEIMRDPDRIYSLRWGALDFGALLRRSNI
jgi:mannosyltransferase